MSWLGDSAALAILSFDVDAESPILVEGRRYADDLTLMSHQAYGPQVAVPRILGLLEEYSLPATFFVPGYTADHYPESVERIAAAGHEIAHHGYSHHSPLRMDEAAERADLERALQALERLGVKPEGYRTPSWEPSLRTFDLLAEHGFAYDSSLMDDDKPYLLETARRDAGRAPAALEPGRLEPVRVHARSAQWPRHRPSAVARDRALAIGSWTGCAATAASSSSPCTRSSAAGPAGSRGCAG